MSTTRTWKPSKYEKYRGKWRASRTSVPVASRIIADLQVTAYERALQQHARGSLIDLGCGKAPLTGIYAPLVSTFHWADWCTSPHAPSNLDFEVDLSNPLPIQDSAYDTVLLSDVLEHLPEPARLLREIKRILRPGGRLIVGVPFLYWVHEEPHDHFRFTKYQLEHLGRTAELDIEEITELGGALDVWADLSAKVCSAIWKPLALAPYTLRSAALLLPAVRRLNSRTSSRFPLAYLAIYSA